MQVWYKTLSGETKPLNLNCHESVENVKLKISRSEGVSLDQIHLIYQGNPLEQGNLNDYGIMEDDTLFVVLKNRSVIQISVRQPNGATTTLEVEPSELVQNIKNMLEEKLGCLVDQQVLKFNGKILEGGRLTHHGISDNATLHLALKAMQIIVKGFDSRSHTFVVQATDSVDDLKNKIHREIGIVPSQQRLVHGTKQLDRGLLRDYGIKEGSMVQMMGRLRGG